MTLRVSGVVNDSITDGPGLRLAVFAQGCPHKCPGCHNPGTHDFTGGSEIDIRDIAARAADNPLLDGVTFTGGEPFAQAAGFAALGKVIKEKTPGLNIVTYTGWTWEELLDMPEARALLEVSDYIVDGRFVEALRSLDLTFKGSANQRFIDVKQTLERGEVVEYIY